MREFLLKFAMYSLCPEKRVVWVLRMGIKEIREIESAQKMCSGRREILIEFILRSETNFEC
jgi:hypothetical protein